MIQIKHQTSVAPRSSLALYNTAQLICKLLGLCVWVGVCVLYVTDMFNVYMLYYKFYVNELSTLWNVVATQWRANVYDVYKTFGKKSTNLLCKDFNKCVNLWVDHTL